MDSCFEVANHIPCLTSILQVSSGLVVVVGVAVMAFYIHDQVMNPPSKRRRRRERD